MRTRIRPAWGVGSLRLALRGWVGSGVVGALGVWSAAHANTPAPGATAEPDSVVERRLGFRPAPHPGDIFGVSHLTISYEKTVASFSNPNVQKARDLAWLDRYGDARPRTADADSSDIRLVDEAKRRATELTPEEKKALAPPAPPVHVGIPSPMAIGASLAGGVVLLAKVIAALLR
jgi:hypothetical protein